MQSLTHRVNFPTYLVNFEMRDVVNFPNTSVQILFVRGKRQMAEESLESQSHNMRSQITSFRFTVRASASNVECTLRGPKRD